MTAESLSAADFELVRRVVRERTAMLIGSGKESFVLARLKTLAQKIGQTSVDELLAQLRAHSSTALEAQVAEVMTVNETLFFRDSAPFGVLRSEVLPALIERRASSRRLDIWSAASSTGQEPVSLAIMLREHFPALRTWHVKILATDVSHQAVKHTFDARYNELEIGRGLDGCLRDKYFHRDGPQWQANADIRGMIEARQMNLAAPWPVGPTWDLVLMRNVLIYFDVEVRRSILSRARARMHPDASLFLGSSETTMSVDDGWKMIVSGGAVRFTPKAVTR